MGHAGEGCCHARGEAGATGADAGESGTGWLFGRRDDRAGIWSLRSAALAVARCESGLNPSAYNPTSIGGSHAEGVFQILYPSTWDSTPEAASSPYNAAANIEAAHAIFVRDGYNWHEWSC